MCQHRVSIENYFVFFFFNNWHKKTHQVEAHTSWDRDNPHSGSRAGAAASPGIRDDHAAVAGGLRFDFQCRAVSAGTRRSMCRRIEAHATWRAWQGACTSRSLVAGSHTGHQGTLPRGDFGLGCLARGRTWSGRLWCCTCERTWDRSTDRGGETALPLVQPGPPILATQRWPSGPLWLHTSRRGCHGGWNKEKEEILL